MSWVFRDALRTCSKCFLPFWMMVPRAAVLVKTFRRSTYRTTSTSHLSWETWTSTKEWCIQTKTRECQIMQVWTRWHLMIRSLPPAKSHTCSDSSIWLRWRTPRLVRGSSTRLQNSSSSRDWCQGELVWTRTWVWPTWGSTAIPQPMRAACLLEEISTRSPRFSTNEYSDIH